MPVPLVIIRLAFLLLNNFLNPSQCSS
ncbi:hypothetical protein F383_32380 [Gossypium arboreum]|uniref:Uncharacterized protein n=1 Tax=Gossypium arboreum TaxID=29729 RepID=A0A0B0N0B6_GOSAR|nr:hypothetical protein F383_32380 [Gossypium arboreum]